MVNSITSTVKLPHYNDVTDLYWITIAINMYRMVMLEKMA